MVSFVAAILFLTRKKKGDSADYDAFSYRAILLGVPFLTLGILTGAMWAEQAWGNYWSWDPKETWAFITWLTYLAYLHTRRFSGWEGTKSAWFAVAAFGVVLFTYFGVNYLLTGLHSYAK